MLITKAKLAKLKLQTTSIHRSTPQYRITQCHVNSEDRNWERRQFILIINTLPKFGQRISFVLVRVGLHVKSGGESEVGM